MVQHTSHKFQLNTANLHANENVVSLLLTFFSSVLAWARYCAVKLAVEVNIKWYRLCDWFNAIRKFHLAA